MNLLAALGTGAIVGIVVAVVLVLLLIILVAWYISTHNKFVSLRSSVEEAFSTMDVYLKKRYDLIPNLVETVKGYAKHESDVLRGVTEARANAQAANTTAEKLQANAQLTQALRSFNMVMERYPELKANQNFMSLQNDLRGLEGEIANARKYYNGIVKAFNTKRETIPSSIVAKMMKLEKQPYFEVEDAVERQNVKVSF
ncbi:MAG: LemA family protein [Clostridiales bacterium]|nr:LemA family protein [Clostridiales bacterium]